jgi:hypothetical protein
MAIAQRRAVVTYRIDFMPVAIEFKRYELHPAAA